MTAGSLLALDGVGKDYAKVETRGGRLRLVWDLLRGHGAAHVFRALDDVSFTMQRGESLGIIGENGAGKSTLLKVVAGVVQPTRGSVSVNGRVGALLELGSGFHPDYTGLANIDLAAALLGLAPSELGAKRDEIIAFADLGEHIHDPLKQYSSGMVVRLGFAVATALSPDVLITDEVLAVGDESFQKRCVAWMERYLENGGTLLLCSHSMYHIQKLCTHALWLKDGRVERYGAAADVTQAYLAYHEEKDAHARRPVSADRAAASGWYAINALTVEPAELLEQGAALHGARRSLFAGRPRPGRADRHRARGWHAGVRRGNRHGELAAVAPCRASLRVLADIPRCRAAAWPLPGPGARARSGRRASLRSRRAHAHGDWRDARAGIRPAAASMAVACMNAPVAQ